MPAAAADAARAHPLVRQAMEIFDATAVRVRPVHARPAAERETVADPAAAEPVIDGPAAEEPR